MTELKEGGETFKRIVTFVMIVAGGSPLLAVVLAIFAALLPTDSAIVEVTIDRLWDAFTHALTALIALLGGKRFQ